MRKCPCGSVIDPTAKTIEWGRAHGRDLSAWPTKCNACLVDWAIGLFALVEGEGLPEKPAILGKVELVPAPPRAKGVCVFCSTPLGSHYFSDVPGVGDLCVVCQATHLKGKS